MSKENRDGTVSKEAGSDYEFLGFLWNPLHDIDRPVGFSEAAERRPETIRIYQEKIKQYQTQLEQYQIISTRLFDSSGQPTSSFSEEDYIDYTQLYDALVVLGKEIEEIERELDDQAYKATNELLNMWPGSQKH